MNTLDKFIRDYGLLRNQGLAEVTSSDLDDLGRVGYSPEELLGYLAKHYNALLHGSWQDIMGGKLLPGEKGEIFCTDSGAIALLKAIVSSRDLRHPGLQYPFFISGDTPLEVRVHGIQFDTIGDRGFVYVVPGRTGFVNKPEGSWQYISKHPFVPFSAQIEVSREHFTYPIIDADTGQRVQEDY